MRTPELIALLAADIRPARPIGRSLLIAGLGGGIAAGLLFVALVGVRSDLPGALANPWVAFKFLFTAVMVVTALIGATRLLRPEPTALPVKLLLVPMVLLAAATAVDAVVTPRALWARAATGISPLTCLAMIIMTSLLPVFSLLWAARAGAPRYPGKAGAAAGLAGSSMGAWIFALYCPNDSALFVAVWYVIAMIIVAVCASIIGIRLIKW